LVDVRYRDRELSCSQTERQNERLHNSASIDGVITAGLSLNAVQICSV